MAQLGRALPAGMVDVPLPAARPRPDAVAAILLLLAGAIGLWQLLLPWRAADAGGSLVPPGAADPTGWQVYRVLRAMAAPAPEVSWATLAVLGVGVGGGALIVLGLAMMAPINHRPLGAAALLISLLSVAGALWVAVHARMIFDVGVFSLFGQAGPGWYLFLGAGLLGLAGSWRALASG
jgi:hypothetical protein